MGKNVLIDDVPETNYGQIWLGNKNIFPQKLQIGFSCPKMISSVKMRNSARVTYYNTKDFEINVREPNSTQWIAFISGRLSNPNVQNPLPLDSFTGTAVNAKEVELSCLNTYHESSSINSCALNYIGFA